MGQAGEWPSQTFVFGGRHLCMPWMLPVVTSRSAPIPTKWQLLLGAGPMPNFELPEEEKAFVGDEADRRAVMTHKKRVAALQARTHLLSDLEIGCQ